MHKAKKNDCKILHWIGCKNNLIPIYFLDWSPLDIECNLTNLTMTQQDKYDWKSKIPKF